MAANLSHPVRHYIERLKEAHHRAKGKVESKMGEAKTALEVIGAGTAASYLMGRIEQTSGKPLEFFGVSADLGVGALLLGAGLFDLAGKYDEDALLMGIGVVTAHMGRKGYDFGKSAAVEHRFLGMSSVGGLFGANRSVDQDLAARLRTAA